MTPRPTRLPIKPIPMNEIRIPPQDTVSEEAVIGAVLVSAPALVEVMGFLKPEHFYRQGLGFIFQACLNLQAKGQPSDAVTVANELKTMGKFELMGGSVTLRNLVEMVPTASNIEHYAQIVLEKFKARELINICSQVITNAYTETETSKDIKENLINDLFKGDEHIGVLDPMAMAGKVYENFTDKKVVHYIPTGYEVLDRFLSGIRVGSLGTITGPFESGKSTFLQNVSVQVAKRGVLVLHLALEDKATNIIARQMCLMSGTRMDRLQSTDALLMAPSVKADLTGKWANLGIRVGSKKEIGKSWKRIKLLMIEQIMRHGVKVIFLEGAERLKIKPEYGESKYDAQDMMVDELDDIAQDYNVGIWVIVGQSHQQDKKWGGNNTREGGSAAWGRIPRQRIFIERHENHDSQPDVANISVLKITKNSDAKKGPRTGFWFLGNPDTYKWIEQETVGTDE